MRLKNLKYFFLALLTGGFSSVAEAQAGLCPPNLDFEMGNFNNWNCRIGSVDTQGSVNNIVWYPGTNPVPGRHTIIDSATAGIDFYGGFPEICPNGSGFSVKLGNANNGSEAESISYKYNIPANATTFSILFYCAIVLQLPGHSPIEQPRFKARIIDLSANSAIPCINFDFAAASSLPGWQVSPFLSRPIYRDWTPVTINLSGYAGKTIMLEFITADCTAGGHFAYAYLDVNPTCNGAITGTAICQGDNAITLTAPFGFKSYAWYSDTTFATLLDTTQTLPLNPAPPPGTVIPVIVNPYLGFGCRDTLYATITVSPKPVSVAGPDTSICKYQQGAFQIGGPSTLGYTYAWTPASQVSNPNIPNPIAFYTPPNPVEFIVKTTDILTGCFSYDTTIIATTVVDTVVAINGKVDFCDGDAIGATLSVNNSSAPVRWFDGVNLIPGATGISYQPLATGSYWAEITQSGCVDTTSGIAIAVHPLPLASFTASSDSGCVTNNSFLFTNASTVSDGSAMTYLWKFGDGSTQTVTDATKTFLNAGNYITKLVTTTSNSCKDSTTHTVHVLPNAIANFTWDSICINRPVLFYNLSNEHGSAQVNYNWTFNDGGPGSVIKNPLPVVYTTTGQRDVTLKLTALGCENNPDSIIKKVQVNVPKPGITYRTITVPQGSSQFIHVRDGIGTIYNWRPQLQLSSYNTRYTEFFAVTDDVKYLIDITNKNTCVTTDTMQMLILKKPGFYLPTAFTPNGDGLNDEVQPYLIGMKGLKSFSVFNRWGNLVFYTTTYNKTWNGKFQGVDQNPGVYVWILEFFNNNNQKVMEKGTITLIR